MKLNNPTIIINNEQIENVPNPFDCEKLPKCPTCTKEMIKADIQISLEEKTILGTHYCKDCFTIIRQTIELKE